MECMGITDTPGLWAALKWSSGHLSRTNRLIQPLEVTESPRAPGIYRFTWDGAEWHVLQKTFTVRSSRKVVDPTVDFSDMMPPVVLTIGRATDMHARIRQHFGTNLNNNRVIKRLSGIMPGKSADEIRDIAIQNLVVEWVIERDWRKRWVLERYGCGIEAPLLDFEAEH